MLDTVARSRVKHSKMASSKEAMGAAKQKSKVGEDQANLIRNNIAVDTLVEAKRPNNEITSTKQDDEKPQTYIYRDFRNINHEDFDVDYEIEQEGLLKV